MSPDTSFVSPAIEVRQLPDLSHVRCRVETVTPEMAGRWLERLPHRTHPAKAAYRVRVRAG